MSTTFGYSIQMWTKLYSILWPQWRRRKFAHMQSVTELIYWCSWHPFRTVLFHYIYTGLCHDISTLALDMHNIHLNTSIYTLSSRPVRVLTVYISLSTISPYTVHDQRLASVYKLDILRGWAQRIVSRWSAVEPITLCTIFQPWRRSLGTTFQTACCTLGN